MIEVPTRLYYNCMKPYEVLKEKNIRASKVYRRAAVSMSANPNLISHGEFKIIFRKAPWFESFKPKLYMFPIFEDPNARFKKIVRYVDQFGNSYPLDYELEDPFQSQNPMFVDEVEWYSLSEVQFSITDVEKVVLMKTGRKRREGVLRKVLRRIAEEFPSIHTEIQE